MGRATFLFVAQGRPVNAGEKIRGLSHAGCLKCAGAFESDGRYASASGLFGDMGDLGSTKAFYAIGMPQNWSCVGLFPLPIVECALMRIVWRKNGSRGKRPVFDL